MLETLTALLTVHRLPAVFVGAFFFGDSVFFTAAYLAGQLQWPVFPIFATAFIGTAAADTMWFFLGIFFAQKFSGTGFMRHRREKAAALLARLTGERPAYALIFIKFLYGSRIAMILYVAARGLSFRTFAIYNSIGIFVWLAIFFPVGYLAGKGISSSFPILNVIEAAVIVFVASFVLMRVLTIWLTRKVTGE
jgi:membrane protein DedA with SNARE-associated domain